MKQSLRAKRRERHHKRLKTGNKLNLVSLMDIFTILVFFLIVNQSEVRVLQNTDALTLPVSVADELPVENIVITVLANTVLVQDRAIWQLPSSNSEAATTEAGVEMSEQERSDFFAALTTELNYQASKRAQLTESEQVKGRAVTILGDSSIPYLLLKQIMAACAETGYRDMSLAVEQKAAKHGSSNAGVG